MEVSPAEIIDRMSIVKLKIEKIGNSELDKEMAALNHALDEFKLRGIKIDGKWFQELYEINKEEWDLLDKMNDEQKKENFEEIGRLYVETEKKNRKRAEVKNKIIEETGEGFKEIKKGHVSENGEGDLEISLETARGGIKESCVLPEHLINYEVNINENTKAVLISPDMGKITNKDEIIIPNLHNGLFRIMTFLYDNGIDVVTLDTSLDNTQSAWEKIKEYKPPFIAFSPYYDSIKNDLKNMERVIKASPESIIIIGGFEASLNSQWEMLGGIIDILVKGEGELPLMKLILQYQRFFKENPNAHKKDFLENLKKIIELHPIPGVSILTKGEPVKMSPVKNRIDPEFYQEINLNAFQKHLELSPIERYWKINRWLFEGKKDAYFRFVSSDHCPYKCIFCQSSVYYAKIMGTNFSPVRYVTAENILKILRAISNKYPFINGIYIDDENFIINRERAVEALNMIIQSRESGELRKDITFQCRTRTDNIAQEICKLLKQANFETISVGSESYSPNELKYMNKNTTPEQNLKAIKTIYENGLKVAENYILFTPETTKDSFYESAMIICKNIRELDVDGTATLFFTPLPGTKLWGEGHYEVFKDFPYKNEFFKDKVMFHSNETGYDYIGEEIPISNTDIVLPHPEIILVKDPLIRKVSIKFLKYLPKTVEKFREIAGGKISLSRRFITLANLSAACEVLYKLTQEIRWKELNADIINTVKEKLSKNIISNIS